MAAFRRRLGELGWVEGRNLRIDERGDVNDAERSEDERRQLIDDLIRTSPDVILSANPTLKLLQQATQTIPVVFVLANDPLAEGSVASLARPGANLTGFALAETEFFGKSVQLLRDVAPHITRVGAIYDPINVGMKRLMEGAAVAAARLGLGFSNRSIRNVADIEGVIEEFAREPNGGMIIPSNGPINANLARVVALTRHHRIPTIGPFRFFAEGGGLMTYGPDDIDMMRGAASYADRILKGEQPAGLPVQFPSKYQLVVNLTTAKAIGLDLPQALSSIVDEFID
jgi:putative ABC transport system substrate-binding protein